ncbi:MAG: hypothetical protein AAGL10_03880 [Pseudomonadota bacterium]
MRYPISISTLKRGAILSIAASVAVGASIASAAISSNVYIDAKETFVLGGKQPGAFSVKGTNKGEVTVEIYASDEDGAVLVGTVAPGDAFKANFAKDEAAWLRNTSTNARAHVRVRITGTTSNLGMGYQGWDETSDKAGAL